MTTAAGKPRTEAQQIITRLQFAGMKRAEIAKQIGVSADVISNISRGLSSGDTYLVALRSIANFAPRRAENTSSNTSNDAAPALPLDGPSATSAVVPALEVEEAPQEPERSAGDKIKQGIKDAILGKGPAPLVSAPKGKGGAKADNADLVQQLVPTLALGVVILSHAITPARYVAVDPTHAEAAAMLEPIVRIMTRQMDAAGKLTETQMDLLQCLMAVGMYGQRAFTTYREIRANDEPHVHAQAAQAAHARRDTGQSSQPARPADAQQRGQLAPVAASAASVPANGANGSRPTAEHPGANEVGKFNPFAELYNADAIGRRQLGIG